MLFDYCSRVDALCSWFEAMFSTEKLFANQCFEVLYSVKKLIKKFF